MASFKTMFKYQQIIAMLGSYDTIKEASNDVAASSKAIKPSKRQKSLNMHK